MTSRHPETCSCQYVPGRCVMPDRHPGQDTTLCYPLIAQGIYCHIRSELLHMSTYVGRLLETGLHAYVIVTTLMGFGYLSGVIPICLGTASKEDSLGRDTANMFTKSEYRHLSDWSQPSLASTEEVETDSTECTVCARFARQRRYHCLVHLASSIAIIVLLFLQFDTRHLAVTCWNLHNHYCKSHRY